MLPSASLSQGFRQAFADARRVLYRIPSVRVRVWNNVLWRLHSWRYVPTCAERLHYVCLCPSCCYAGRGSIPGNRAAVILSRMRHDSRPRAGFGFQFGILAVQVTYHA